MGQVTLPRTRLKRICFFGAHLYIYIYSICVYIYIYTSISSSSSFGSFLAWSFQRWLGFDGFGSHIGFHEASRGGYPAAVGSSFQLYVHMYIIWTPNPKVFRRLDVQTMRFKPNAKPAATPCHVPTHKTPSFLGYSRGLSPFWV